ncbi:LuxR C-terminal-related transcriptional regulator [Actinocrispum sp. NPDC049592]|uniref:response regulator transcription factor n=1 Tax=Actinocrispum sp. NPDC049592 TaxID=3154835 RepID=UPI003427EA16
MDAVSSTRQPVTGLTARERKILVLIASGHGNAEIARAIGCSQHTVKNTIYDLMSRLRLRNRVHAAAYAVREGLV